MSVFETLSTDVLLTITVTAFVLGAAMLVAPFLGVGARKDKALQSMLGQVSAHHPEPATYRHEPAPREAFIGEIVDEAPTRS